MDYPDDYLSLSFSVPLDKGIEDSGNEFDVQQDIRCAKGHWVCNIFIIAK